MVSRESIGDQRSPTGYLKLRNAMLSIYLFNANKCSIWWISTTLMSYSEFHQGFHPKAPAELCISQTDGHKTLHQGRRARDALNSTRRISEALLFVEKVLGFSRSRCQYKTISLINAEEEETCTQWRNFCARPWCICIKCSLCIPVILQKVSS